MSSGLGAMLDKAAGPIAGKLTASRLTLTGAPTSPSAGRGGFMALLTALESPTQAPLAGSTGSAAREASAESVQGLPAFPGSGVMAPGIKQAPGMTASEPLQTHRNVPAETEPHAADLTLFLQQSGATVLGMPPSDTTVQADWVTQGPDKAQLPAGVPPGQECLLFGQPSAGMAMALSSVQNGPPEQGLGHATAQSQAQPISTGPGQPSSPGVSEASTGPGPRVHGAWPGLPSPRDVAQSPVFGESLAKATSIEPSSSSPQEGPSSVSLSGRPSQPGSVSAVAPDRSTMMRPLPAVPDAPGAAGQAAPQTTVSGSGSSNSVADPPAGLVGQLAVPTRASTGLEQAIPFFNQGVPVGQPNSTRASGREEPLSLAKVPFDLAPAPAGTGNAAPILAPRRSSAETPFGVEPAVAFRTVEPVFQEVSSSSGPPDDQGRTSDTGQRNADSTTVTRTAELPWVQAIGNAELRYSDSLPVNGAAPASPESVIAETVTYWVAQGIQNAELKLEAWGGQALEVSISMNGNQAEVEFRTDQSDIRQVIEGAMPQLKDMLAGEGLVLSGVAIGGSSSQSSDSSGRRPPQGSRQLRVSQAEEEVATVQRRSGSGVGQALDLFV